MRPTARAWTEADENAETERPSALSIWKCDGEGAEPTQFATLIEATGCAPATPEAQVYGGGALLAISDDADAVWTFSEEGMQRLQAEMTKAIDRDSDTVLSVLIPDDLREAVGS